MSDNDNDKAPTMKPDGKGGVIITQAGGATLEFPTYAAGAVWLLERSKILTTAAIEE